MSTVRVESIIIAFNRSVASTDYNIHNDFHKVHEFKQKIILADKSLTKDEKTEAIRVFMIEKNLYINQEQKEIVKSVD